MPSASGSRPALRVRAGMQKTSPAAKYGGRSTQGTAPGEQTARLRAGRAAGFRRRGGQHGADAPCGEVRREIHPGDRAGEADVSLQAELVDELLESRALGTV